MSGGDVEDFLSEKYKNNEEVKVALIELFSRYRDWGLADRDFDTKLTNEEHYEASIWEMVLADHLNDLGHKLSSADEGPDIGLTYDGQKIWVEAVCPKPEGLPEDWLNIRSIEEPGRLLAVPHEEMLLRWTSAIKEKKEKLTGRLLSSRKWQQGYLEKETIANDEPYVIAVSSCRLGYGYKFLHEGISELPYAVEAAFPVGPVEIVFDREKAAVTEQRLSYRATIKKPNGAEVPTDSFFNPEYQGVSAILGTPAGINHACGTKAPFALVHNPLAINKLPVGILGADQEYVATEVGDSYELHDVSKKASEE